MRDQESGKQTNHGIVSITANPSGTRVAVVRTDNSVRTYRVSGDRLVPVAKVVNAHQNLHPRVLWHPLVESRLATVGGDKAIKVWKVNGTIEREIGAGKCKFLLARFAPDGKHVAAACGQKLVVVDLHDDSHQSVSCGAELTALEWTVGGNYIVAGLADGQLLFVSPEKLQVVQRVQGPVQGITQIVLDPRGEYVGCGCDDGNVYFWRSSDLQNHKTLSKADVAVSLLCVDGKRELLCVGRQEETKIYDLHTLSEIESIHSESKSRTACPVEWIPGIGVVFGDGSRLMFAVEKGT